MRVMVIGAALLGVTACGGEDQNIDPTTGEVDGRLVYQNQCMVCHGETGADGTSDAANLSTSMLTVEEMQEAVKYGRGNMNALDYLSEDEVNAAVDYVRTELKKKGH